MRSESRLQPPVAIVQLFAGREREAYESAQAVLRGAEEPDARMLLVLATIAFDHDNVVKARELADLAGEIGGVEGWRQVLLGRLALKASDTAAARQAARAAAADPPAIPQIVGELGVLFSRTGLHEEALPFLDAAARALPGDAQLAYNRAIALQFVGRLDEARAAFEALVAERPDHAQAWLALVALAPDRHADHLPLLERAYRDAASPDDRLALGHAIARVHEDAGRWDESFEWLQRAKAGKRDAARYRRDDAEALFAAAARSAEQPVLPLSGDQAPLFIVGLPRSGTTLVERILSAHPQVRSAGELSDFAILLKRAVATPGPLVLDRATIDAGANAQLAGLDTEYIARARSIVGDVPRFIDKMPFNLFFVPAILRSLPGARVICLRRSPFDALFSNYRQLFATAFTYYSHAYDFADTAHFVAEFERLADRYAQVLPPERFLTVRYENVVENFDAEARRMVAFAGLEWDPACAEFHRSSEPVATASSLQVRKPIYRSAVARWRRYGDAAERAVAEFARYGIVPDR